MNKRLREIVQYKTHGKNKPFAELVGWTPQYLGKLLHGNDFGLKPVLSVLLFYDSTIVAPKVYKKPPRPSRMIAVSSN